MVLSPEPGQAREIQVRVVGQNAGLARASSLFQLGRQDHRTGKTGVELGTVSAMAEKTDVIRPCRMQRCQALHLLRGQALQLSTEGADNESEAQRHSSRFTPRSLGRVKRLDDLLGDVMFGVDVDSLLEDHIVLF